MGIERESTPGTPMSDSPFFDNSMTKLVICKTRIEFGFHDAHADIEGSADTLQDLRDVLRKFLAELESR